MNQLHQKLIGMYLTHNLSPDFGGEIVAAWLSENKLMVLTVSSVGNISSHWINSINANYTLNEK